MRLRNTSRYDTKEVRRLVAFALSEIDHRDLQVNVKNCGKAAFAGTAYEAVPRCSPAHGKAERLVVLRIGAESRFPCDNVSSRPTTRWQDGRAPDSVPADQRQTRIVCTRGVQKFQWRRLERMPYGGKSSPVIECADWREGLVALAAHEGMHIEQFQYNKPRSEVEAETYAAQILGRYRKEFA